MVDKDGLIMNFSPYFFTPFQQVSPQELELKAWEGFLTYWLSPNQNMKKDELVLQNYIQVLIQEFIRLEFSSNLPKLYKIPHGFTDWFRLEAKLLGTLLRLMERLRTLGVLPINEPMALLINRLLVEHRIVVFCKTRDDFQPTSRGGANAFIRTIQNQNKQIRSFENPFPTLPNELSGQLIQVAIETAEKNNQFKKQFLNPVVDARSALSAHIRPRHPLIVENGVPKNQRTTKKKK